jgi:hypothetical protein
MVTYQCPRRLFIGSTITQTGDLPPPSGTRHFRRRVCELGMHESTEGKTGECLNECGKIGEWGGSAAN